MQTPDSLLLIEDDDLDAAITIRSLKQLHVPCEVVRKTDGEEALEYLRVCSGNTPSAILLDLNMPRMNGLECLRHIRADASMRNIPVLVVTTSSAQEDIEGCRRLGAVEYIVKDWDFHAFVESLKCVEKYCGRVTVGSVASAACTGQE